VTRAVIHMLEGLLATPPEKGKRSCPTAKRLETLAKAWAVLLSRFAVNGVCSEEAPETVTDKPVQSPKIEQ